MKTVLVAAIAGAVLGPFSVWSLRQQHNQQAAPAPSWFRDTAGAVCSNCSPLLAAADGQVMASWRHPGSGETLAVSYGRDGSLDRYDLRGPQHARAHAVAFTDKGTPALLFWDGSELRTTMRGASGWQKTVQLAPLRTAPAQLQLAFSDGEPVAAWLSGGRIQLAGRTGRHTLPGSGAVSEFALEGGADPVVVWHDRAGAALWRAGRTVRLGAASVAPQLAGGFLVWRSGADIRLATVSGQAETIASGATSGPALAVTGQTVLVADQEDGGIVLRTLAGRHVSLARFPLPPHSRVSALEVAADPSGAAAIVWKENGTLVDALARPAGKPWSRRPSELARRDEEADALQLRSDQAGRMFVVWDNHGFIGETVEIAEITLSS